MRACIFPRFLVVAAVATFVLTAPPKASAMAPAAVRATLGAVAAYIYILDEAWSFGEALGTWLADYRHPV